MTRHRLIIATLRTLALYLFLFAASAHAQSTGSSFGGGDWGGGGGGGGGGGSSGSGYASSGSSSGVSYDDPNAYEPPYLVQCVIVIAFLGLLYLIFRWISRAGQDRRRIDVAMVQIAIDARARRFVQTALRNLGKSGDTHTGLGRAMLLRATSSALASSKLAWIYAGAKNFDPMLPAKAQTEMQRLANDARAGFQYELDRSVDGKKSSTSAPEMAPQEHEGDGAVLVTVIVAARTKLRNVDASRPGELDALLADIAAIPPATLVAIEVVWTPSTENDRMSTDELEVRYPTLTKLEGAIGGRVYCASCHGPHAAELTACPHCGAPVGAV